MLGLRTLVPVLATAILLVAPAEATTSYYAGGASAEAAFTGALGTLTLLSPTLTFSSGDLAAGGLYNANGTGINFLGFDDFNFNTPTNFSVVSGRLTATQAGEVVTINFPAAPAIYAFGIHISVVSSFATWCIELTHPTCNYSVTNASNSDANVQFFGFVSDTPVTAPLYIRPQNFSPSIVLRNFSAYTVSDAPEPAALGLVGLGLVILPLIRRKIRRRI